jgi:hypothetical protein
VSERRLKASGLLIVCRAEDAAGLEAARAFDRPETQRSAADLTLRFGGARPRLRKLVLTFVPPSAD